MIPLAVLAEINIALTATTGAVALVLAMLYWMGLKFSSEGKSIMRAIIIVWLAIAARQFAVMYFDLQIAAGKVSPTTPHFLVSIPINSFLMLASLYYLWATIKRNPPKAEDTALSEYRNIKTKSL